MVRIDRMGPSGVRRSRFTSSKAGDAARAPGTQLNEMTFDGSEASAPNGSALRCACRTSFVFVPKIDAPFGQVVHRQFEPDAIAGKNADMVSAHATRGVRPDDRAVFECDAKPAVRKHFIDDTVEFQQFFFRQINFSKATSHRKGGGTANPIPYGSGSSASLARFWWPQRVLCKHPANQSGVMFAACRPLGPRLVS